MSAFAKLILPFLFFLAPPVNAAPLHSDPTMSGNIRLALRYVGKLTEKELKALEDLPLDEGMERIKLLLDSLVRRQGAQTPLKYPLPPFRNVEVRETLFKTNPHSDLFPEFKKERLTEELRPILSKDKASPIELASDISKFSQSGKKLNPKQLESLQDEIGVFIIQCYNTLIVKAGHCHGPTRPLPEAPTH